MPDTQPSHVTPSTELIICSGIPFESNYEHVITFGNKEMQYDYFYGKRKVVLAPQGTPSAYYTYQRTNDGKIRIGCAIEQVINCNYLMFRNQAFENKWFYAFIQEINYVNNSVTEIVYEIDVMQTWMFDYTLQECFVEREHSVTDEVGDNTVPENLEVGEYVFTSIDKTFDDIWDFAIDVVAPFEIDIDMGAISPITITYEALTGFYNNLFSGFYHNIFYLDPVGSEPALSDISWALWRMTQNDKSQIIAIYTIPRFMAHDVAFQPDGVNGYTKAIEKSYSWVYSYDNSGTTPTPIPIKNKKLYTYPFNKLYVTSSDGEKKDYKYELFSTQSCIFNYYGVLGVPPEILLCPVGYASTTAVNTSAPVENEHIHTLSLKNFPMSGWATDGFKAWLTQTATTIGGGLLATAVMPELVPALGVAAQAESLQAFAGMSFAASAYGAIANLGKESLTNSQHAHGTNKNMPLLALNDFGFHFYNAHIKPEYAAIIDDYFTKYGYATKRVKVPNRFSRLYWNYVETKDCNINQGINTVGGLNNLDTRKICDVYNHGVTFWHAQYHAAGSHVVDVEVGNYSLDNRTIP